MCLNDEFIAEACAAPHLTLPVSRALPAASYNDSSENVKRC